MAGSRVPRITVADMQRHAKHRALRGKGAEPQRAGLLTRAPINGIHLPVSRLNRQMKLPI